jgi:hypothetical protein
MNVVSLISDGACRNKSILKKKPFMDTERSSPRSQVPAICPCSEPYQSRQSPRPFPWRAILILYPPSIPVPSKWSRSIMFPHQNPVCSSPFPIHATCRRPTISQLKSTTRGIPLEGQLQICPKHSEVD